MTPIKVFTINELGIDEKKYINKLRGYYDSFEYDEYLYRQNIIKRCVENGMINFSKDSKIIEDYYLNGNDCFFEKLQCDKKIFSDIKKSRKRMICCVLVNKNGEVKRERNKNFYQHKAGVVDGIFDFRVYPRVFKQAPDELLDDDTLKIIKRFTDLIFNDNPQATQIKVVIHYTIIEASFGSDSSNSPEGIHQDGMDYIVSAIVIERCNVIGGVSNIYYPDYKNKLLEVELQSGMGIFQPDLNTDIWHGITNIFVDDESKCGFRSTIGFDFEVIK